MNDDNWYEISDVNILKSLEKFVLSNLDKSKISEAKKRVAMSIIFLDLLLKE